MIYSSIYVFTIYIYVFTYLFFLSISCIGDFYSQFRFKIQIYLENSDFAEIQASPATESADSDQPSSLSKPSTPTESADSPKSPQTEGPSEAGSFDLIPKISVGENLQKQAEKMFRLEAEPLGRQRIEDVRLTEPATSTLIDFPRSIESPRGPIFVEFLQKIADSSKFFSNSKKCSNLYLSKLPK